MKLDGRWVRLRAVWLLILPFLYFARPTPSTLLVGAIIALAGAALRGWAAGYLRKNDALSTDGPYAFTRNPLYVGSFLIGTGFAVSGNVPLFVLLFVLFFSIVYGRVARQESRFLEARFGDRYRNYAARVPLFLPRLSPYRPDAGKDSDSAFTLKQYGRNREYEAMLGIVAGFAFLALKLAL